MLKKRYIIIALGIVSVLLGGLIVNNIILAQFSSAYDPWIDYDDDGDIDYDDFIKLAGAYGSTGTPINKTALLLDILDKVESLEAIIAYLSIIPNGDFEMDPTGTSYNDISQWNHTSYCADGVTFDEQLEIVDDYYFSGSKSLYSYAKSNLAHEHRGRVYQWLGTENNVITSCDYISLWIGGEGYTTSSRYHWDITLVITDGTNTYSVQLRCDCWGLHEGCIPNHFDYYNATETGADGRTWKRYTRRIPDSIDKSNLSIEIRHRQSSWDGTSTSSWYRLDNIYFSDSEGNPTP